MAVLWLFSSCMAVLKTSELELINYSRRRLLALFQKLFFLTKSKKSKLLICTTRTTRIVYKFERQKEKLLIRTLRPRAFSLEKLLLKDTSLCKDITPRLGLPRTLELINYSSRCFRVRLISFSEKTYLGVKEPYRIFLSEVRNYPGKRRS
jgi:hypothetical protein